MELNDKVTQLEDEIKILKNEVQAVLLDLRESYLNNENPFGSNKLPMTLTQPIIINQPPPAAREEPEEMRPGKNQKREPATETPDNELPGLEQPANEAELISEAEPVYQELAEPTNGAEPAREPELITGAETAREEVTRMWQPEIEMAAHFRPRETTAGPNGKADIDLDTMTGLAQWVAGAVKQLGREKTEAILDISELMGHLAPDLKNILVKFIGPVPEEYLGKVTTRDYLAAIIELDSLLGRDNKSEVALLYILCQENNHR